MTTRSGSRDGGLRDEHLSANLSSTERGNVRDKITVQASAYFDATKVARTGDAYVLTDSNVHEVEGLEVTFNATADNVGAMTLQLNTGTVRSLVRVDGEAFEAGQLSNGDVVKAVWNGTHYRSEVAAPGSGTAGSAVSLVTDNFGNNLTTDADTVQEAMDEIDNLDIAAAASEVTVNTDNFDGNLTTEADTVQEALDEIDNLDIAAAADEVTVATDDFGKNISTDADNVQKALKELNDIDHFFRYTVERDYQTGLTRSQTDNIVLSAVTGETNVYDMQIHVDSGAHALPDDYLGNLGRLTPVKIVSVDNDKVWRGVVQSVQTSTATTATLRIDFTEERTGTFANNESIEVSFGYAILGRLIAGDITVDLANIDGMLADVLAGDLQTLIDFIDDLTAEHMFVESDEFEGLLDTDPAPGVVQQALEVVDKLGDHDEDNHFFSVTPADLTEGKVGYAAEAHGDLNDAGGTQGRIR